MIEERRNVGLDGMLSIHGFHLLGYCVKDQGGGGVTDTVTDGSDQDAQTKTGTRNVSDLSLEILALWRTETYQESRLTCDTELGALSPFCMAL